MVEYIFPGAALAGIVWAVRLEGRVNSHDTLFVERQSQQVERDSDIKNRLVRIENKLDGVKLTPNNGNV